MSDLARAIAFMRDLDDRCAGRIVRFRFGAALFHDRLRRVYDLNFLRVGSESSADALAAEAERLQAHLGHRFVKIDDDALGRRVEPGFRALGWKPERHVVMPHRREPPKRDLSAVREVDYETLRPVWAEGISSEPWADEDVVRQLVEQKRVIGKAIHTRYFAAVLDGAPVSYCELYSDGQTAQIEAVLTLEAYRGRGLASAVVLAALGEARRADHELVFLVADAGDWPQELYRKLGFEPVGRTHRFLLVQAHTESSQDR